MAERRPNTPNDLLHKSLLDLVPQGFEQSMVVHVLNHRAELPNEVRRDLNSAINSVVRVPQFPKQPAIAPAPILKQLVIDQLDHKFRATSKRSLTRLVRVTGDLVRDRQGLPLQQGYGRRIS